MDLRHVGPNLHAARQGKYLLGDSPGDDATNRFTRRRTSAAAVVAMAIFSLISIIGV